MLNPSYIHLKNKQPRHLYQLVIGCILLAILSGCLTLPRYLFPTPVPTRQIITSTLPLVVKWQVTASERFRYLPIVYHNFVITQSDTALSIRDAKTGSELWSETGVSLGDIVSLRQAQDNLLAFTEAGARVIKLLDLQHLHVLWTRGTDIGLSPDMNCLSIDAEGVYASWFRPSHVEKYDLKTGELVWRQGGGTWGITSPLVPYGDKLYVFDEGVVRILDKKTGAITGEYKQEGAVKIVGNMFLEWSPYQLLARKLETGDLLWQVQFDTRNWHMGGSVNGKAYVTFEDNRLWMIDVATGRVIWRNNFGSWVPSPVVELDGIGYAMLADGRVVGFDVQTGNKIGELRTRPATTSPLYHDGGLATDGNMLFMTFADHQLFALGEP